MTRESTPDSETVYDVVYVPGVGHVAVDQMSGEQWEQVNALTSTWLMEGNRARAHVRHLGALRILAYRRAGWRWWEINRLMRRWPLPDYGEDD